MRSQNRIVPEPVVIGVPYIVTGVPVAAPKGRVKKELKAWAKRMCRWALVPLEIPSAYLHLGCCMGCCGAFGNPITPVIEDEPYDVVYPDRMSKGMSFLSSGIIGIIHGCGCLFTCAGCCGLACDPKDGGTMVKYE